MTALDPNAFAPPGVPADVVALAARLRDSAAKISGGAVWPVKIALATRLFHQHLDLFAADADPVPAISASLAASSRILENAGVGVPRLAPEAVSPASDIGAIYGDAWTQYPDELYFEESRERLRDRLERNGVEPARLFGGRRVLDAGCGGGNYTLAMAGFGADEVIGIDVGEEGLAVARDKANRAPCGDRVTYRQGSAAAIPLPDASVDLVWSNSVVHVTGDYEKCIREAARVLKPGGTLFLYVDGRMGLFELLMNSLLTMLVGVPRSLTQFYLARLGAHPGRIGWMLANFYVPYERRPKAQVESLLAECGFGKLRQLVRGQRDEPAEQISSGAPFAALKYGEGPLRYLAAKV
jgi:ubiquinone/menaquinone biosynthesis C-methylase UbiE